MKHTRILCFVITIVMIICLFENIAFSKEENSIQVYILDNVKTIFEPGYMLDKNLDQIKKDFLKDESLTRKTIYENGDIETYYINKPSKQTIKETIDYENNSDEYNKNIMFQIDLYKQLADMNLIASRLSRFNIEISDIDKIIYHEIDTKDSYYICKETRAVMAYEAFVFTKDEMYVVCLPIMYDKYYEEKSNKWLNVLDKTYVETYAQWVDSRTLKHNSNVFIEGKKLEGSAFSNRYYRSIPLRKVLENIGAQVKWNEDEQTIIINKDGKVIRAFSLNNRIENYGYLDFFYENPPEDIAYYIFGDAYINIEGTIYLLRPQTVIGDMFWWFDLYVFIDPDDNDVHINSGGGWNGINNPEIYDGWHSPISFY